MSILRRDVTHTLVWAAATPVLAFWPLLSFVPLFAVWESENVLVAFVHLAFAGAGVLGVAGAGAAVWLCASPDGRQTMKTGLRGVSLKLAPYGALWTIAYFGFLWTLR